MRSLRWLLILASALSVPLDAAQYSGTVRAADQFVPSATVTAMQGSSKISAFTDENGRFRMELPPGERDVLGEMFEFTAAHDRVTSGALPLIKNFALEMPRLEERNGAAAAKP